MTVWMGTMVFVPVVLSSVSKLPTEERLYAAARIRAGYLSVATMSMIGTWVLGMTLMLMGGWMTSFWMGLKLVIVIALSGLHGFISGEFRRLANDGSFNLGTWIRPVIAVELFAIFAIAILVIFKPL